MRVKNRVLPASQMMPNREEKGQLRMPADFHAISAPRLVKESSQTHFKSTPYLGGQEDGEMIFRANCPILKHEVKNAVNSPRHSTNVPASTAY
jgi:hypothetical protein